MNNVLTVLSVMLKTAIEWEMIDQLPCSIRLLPVARRDAAFHDFGAYERLLNAALSIDSRTYLIALLGGEVGMRVGEIVALEWADVDLDRRQISHSPLGLARATDDPEERAGTVRGDDGACGDGSSEAPSSPQFTRLV